MVGPGIVKYLADNPNKQGVGVLSYSMGAKRPQAPKEAVQSMINTAIREVYGPGYRGIITSGIGEYGAKRHRPSGYAAAADLVVKDPKGKQITGAELAKLAQHVIAAGYGSAGLQMQGGAIHLDTVTLDKIAYGDEALNWNYNTKKYKGYTPEMDRIVKMGLPRDAQGNVLRSALTPEQRELFDRGELIAKPGISPMLSTDEPRAQAIAAGNSYAGLRNPVDPYPTNDFRAPPPGLSTPSVTPAPTFMQGDKLVTNAPNTVGGGVNSMLGAIGNFASNVYNKAKDATPTPPQGVPASPLDRLRSMNISRNPFDTQQGAKAPVSPVQSSPLPAPVSNPSAPGAAALSKLRSMAEPQGDMRANPFDQSSGTYARGASWVDSQMAAQAAQPGRRSVTGGQAPQAATPARAVTPRETVRALGRATMDPGFTTSDMARRTPVSVPSSPMSQPAKTSENSYTPNYAMKSLGPGPTAPKAPTPSLGTVAGNLAGGLSKVAGYATTGAAKAFAPKAQPKAASPSPPPAPKAIPSSISGFAGNIAGVTGGILGKVGAGALGGLSSLGSLTPAGQAALNAQIAKAQAMLAAPQPAPVSPPPAPVYTPRRVAAPVQPAMPVASLASLVSGGDVRANTPNAPQRIGTAPSGGGLYSFGQDINGVKQVFNAANPSNAFGAMGYGNPFGGMLGGFGGGGPSKSSDNKGQSKSDGGGWGAGSSRPTGGGAGGGLKSGPYGK